MLPDTTPGILIRYPTVKKKWVLFQQSTDLSKLRQAEMVLKGLFNFSNSTEFRAGSPNDAYLDHCLAE